MVLYAKYFSWLKVFFIFLSVFLAIGGLLVMILFMKILQLGYIEGGIGSMIGLITIGLAIDAGYNAYHEKKGKLILYVISMSVIFVLEIVIAVFVYKKQFNDKRIAKWQDLLGAQASFHVLVVPCVLQTISIIVAVIIIRTITIRKRIQREESQQIALNFMSGTRS